MTKNFALEPMGENVILKPIEAPNQTKSGIYIPDTANKEKPQKAEVMAIGPLVSNDENFKTLKVGDFVYYSRYAGDEIKIDDVEYKILAKTSILAREK